MFCKNVALNISQTSQENICTRVVVFLNKYAGCRPTIFFRNFPTAILQNIWERLPLIYVNNWNWLWRKYLKICCSYEAIWKSNLEHDISEKSYFPKKYYYLWVDSRIWLRLILTSSLKIKSVWNYQLELEVTCSIKSLAIYRIIQHIPVNNCFHFLQQILFQPSCYLNHALFRVKSYN